MSEKYGAVTNDLFSMENSPAPTLLKHQTAQIQRTISRLFHQFTLYEHQTRVLLEERSLC